MPADCVQRGCELRVALRNLLNERNDDVHMHHASEARGPRRQHLEMVAHVVLLERGREEPESALNLLRYIRREARVLLDRRERGESMFILINFFLTSG